MNVLLQHYGTRQKAGRSLGMGPGMSLGLGPERSLRMGLWKPLSEKTLVMITKGGGNRSD